MQQMIFCLRLIFKLRKYIAEETNDLPEINAQFVTVSDSVVGVTSAPVKQVEKQDDGIY